MKPSMICMLAKVISRSQDAESVSSQPYLKQWLLNMLQCMISPDQNDEDNDWSDDEEKAGEVCQSVCSLICR